MRKNTIDVWTMSMYYLVKSFWGRYQLHFLCTSLAIHIKKYLYKCLKGIMITEFPPKKVPICELKFFLFFILKNINSLNLSYYSWTVNIQHYFVQAWKRYIPLLTSNIFPMYFWKENIFLQRIISNKLTMEKGK